MVDLAVIRVGLMVCLLAAGGGAAVESAPSASNPAPSAAGSLLDRVIALNRIQEEDLDVDQVRSAFAALVEQARAATADLPTPARKIAELNRVILADRLVSYLSNLTWRDSTLAASLLRKAGNCLSTATLYVLVGRELQLPLHLAVVPNHAFACWEDGGTRINIETTAQGVAVPTEQYVRDLAPEDVAALGWGRPLDDDGFLAELTEAAAGHRQRENRLIEALALFAEVERLAPGRSDLRLAHVRLKGDLSHDRRTEREELDRMAGDETLPPTIRTEAMIGVAEMCAAFRNFEQERAVLLKARDFAPKSAQDEVLSALAFCHRSLRDSRAALHYYERVIAGYPDPTPLRAHHLYNLAILQKNDRQLEAALKSIREALLINPESWNLRLIEAGYLFQGGHREEGLRRFAATKPPRGDVEFYQGMLAWFYAKTLQREQFYRHFEFALIGANSLHTLVWVDQDEDLDPFRKEPEFAKLVEAQRRRILGLPETATGPEAVPAKAPTSDLP
jgi:tetratricopeptide (TPR) repeat protein